MLKKRIKAFFIFLLFVASSTFSIILPLDRWGGSPGKPSDIILERLVCKIGISILLITSTIYFFIEAFNLKKKAGRIMKYLVSIVGASMMFVFTFFLVVSIVALLFPASRQPLNNSYFTNIASLVAFIAASLAGAHSFRATVKYYNKKDSNNSNQETS